MDYTATGQEAITRIEGASDLDALESLRVEFLGKQGSISGVLKMCNLRNLRQGY